MKTLIIGLVMGVGLTLAILLAGKAELGGNPHNPPTITVTGEARLTAQPDTALVTFGLEKTGKTAAEAQEKISQVLNKVIAALQAAGIKKADIYTSEYAIGDNGWYWGSNPKETTVSSNLTITVRKVELVGQMVDTAVANGLTSMQGVRYEIRDPKWKDKVLQEALVDARRKAEVLVPAAEKSRLRLIRLTEQALRQAAPDEPVYPSASGLVSRKIIPLEYGEGLPRTRSLPGQRVITVTLEAVYRF
jgi:uncharacterized protein